MEHARSSANHGDAIQQAAMHAKEMRAPRQRGCCNFNSYLPWSTRVLYHENKYTIGEVPTLVTVVYKCRTSGTEVPGGGPYPHTGHANWTLCTPLRICCLIVFCFFGVAIWWKPSILVDWVGMGSGCQGFWPCAENYMLIVTYLQHSARINQGIIHNRFPNLQLQLAIYVHHIAILVYTRTWLVLVGRSYRAISFILGPLHTTPTTSYLLLSYYYRGP